MFFFFKHKTQYEMRISDWSSDVCSSDLPRLHLPRPEASERLPGIAWCAAAWRPWDTGTGSGSDHGSAAQVRPDPARRRIVGWKPPVRRLDGAEAPQEIGRASCRERVRPYV